MSVQFEKRNLEVVGPRPSATDHHQRTRHQNSSPKEARWVLPKARLAALRCDSHPNTLATKSRSLRKKHPEWLSLQRQSAREAERQCSLDNFGRSIAQG